MAAITEELSLIAEDINNRDPTAIANKTVTDLVTHNDRKIYGDGATMEDLQAERDALFPLYADVLLVQTALHFKQRVLQIWERQVDAERMKFSYSNIISSIDYDEKNATVAEYEAEDLFMKNVAYDLIEPRAYKVPLPASSGGKKRFLSFSAPFPILLLSQSNHDLSSAVFTARGELLLYGGSKLESKKVKNSGKIEDHHGVGVIRPPSYSGFMNYRKSYASLLVKRIKRSAEEESKRTELSSQKNLGAMERSRKNTIGKTVSHFRLIVTFDIIFSFNCIGLMPFLLHLKHLLFSFNNFSVEYNEDSDEQDSLEKSVDDVEDDLEEDEKEEDNMEEEHDMEEDEGYQFSFETEFPVDSPPRKRKALSRKISIFDSINILFLCHTFVNLIEAPKKPKIVKTVVKCDGYEEEKLEDESKKKLVEYNTQVGIYFTCCIIFHTCIYFSYVYPSSHLYFFDCYCSSVAIVANAVCYRTAISESLSSRTFDSVSMAVLYFL